MKKCSYYPFHGQYRDVYYIDYLFRNRTNGVHKKKRKKRTYKYIRLTYTDERWRVIRGSLMIYYYERTLQKIHMFIRSRSANE